MAEEITTRSGPTGAKKGNSEWFAIAPLGGTGLMPDALPNDKPYEALDEAVNVRVNGVGLENAGGYRLLIALPAGLTKPSTLFIGKNLNNRGLVVAGETSIQILLNQVPGSPTWADITGNPVTDNRPDRWSGGWLTGSLFLANRVQTRFYQPGVTATTQPALYDGTNTWEALGHSAECFRPFKNFMFCLSPALLGTDFFPSRVLWSDAVEPGQVPTQWVPAADNLAGDVDLADTPGRVVDAYQLGDKLIIYKTDAIYSCEFVGGNAVFDFSMITTSHGIHGIDCVVEYGGVHYCQGPNDIFAFDGEQSVSLIWGRMKDEWLADRNIGYSIFAFTAVDYEREEILFAYTSNSAPDIFPDKVVTYSLRTGALFRRDYGIETPHIRSYANVFDRTTSDLYLYAIDRTNLRLLELEATPDRDGSPVPALVSRKQLFADPAYDWVQIDQARIQSTGDPLTLELGYQNSMDATITWRTDTDVFDPVTKYKSDVRVNGNLIAYRITVDTTTGWKLSNLNLLVQKSGER